MRVRSCSAVRSSDGTAACVPPQDDIDPVGTTYNNVRAPTGLHDGDSSNDKLNAAKPWLKKKLELKRYPDLRLLSVTCSRADMMP